MPQESGVNKMSTKLDVTKSNKTCMPHNEISLQSPSLPREEFVSHTFSSSKKKLYYSPLYSGSRDEDLSTNDYHVVLAHHLPLSEQVDDKSSLHSLIHPPSPIHLKSAQNRWDYQSQLAGSHAQDMTVLDLSNHRHYHVLIPHIYPTPLAMGAYVPVPDDSNTDHSSFNLIQTLKFGIPPEMRSQIKTFKCRGALSDFHHTTTTSSESASSFTTSARPMEAVSILPEFLDLISILFPSLEHLHIVLPNLQKLTDNNCCQDDGMIYDENGDVVTSSENTTDKFKHLNSADANIEKLELDIIRMQRLYILYRLPDLISINGVDVSEQERMIARPITPSGCKVDGNKWQQNKIDTGSSDIMKDTLLSHDSLSPEQMQLNEVESFEVVLDDENYNMNVNLLHADREVDNVNIGGDLDHCHSITLSELTKDSLLPSLTVGDVKYNDEEIKIGSSFNGTTQEQIDSQGKDNILAQNLVLIQEAKKRTSSLQTSINDQPNPGKERSRISDDNSSNYNLCKPNHSQVNNGRPTVLGMFPYTGKAAATKSIPSPSRPSTTSSPISSPTKLIGKAVATKSILSPSRSNATSSPISSPTNLFAAEKFIGVGEPCTDQKILLPKIDSDNRYKSTGNISAEPLTESLNIKNKGNAADTSKRNPQASADKNLDSFFARSKSRTLITSSHVTDIAITGQLLSRCLLDPAPKSNDVTPKKISTTPKEECLKPLLCSNNANDENKHINISCDEKVDINTKIESNDKRKKDKKERESLPPLVPKLVKVRRKKSSNTEGTSASLLHSNRFNVKRRSNSLMSFSRTKMRTMDLSTSISMIDNLIDDDDSVDSLEEEVDVCSRQVTVGR